MLPELLKEDPFSLQKDQIYEMLEKVSISENETINLPEAALLISKYLDSNLDLSLYLKHLSYVRLTLTKLYTKELPKDGPKDALNLEEKAKFLAKILHEKLSYTGDYVNFDNIENVNLASVIDRRQGMPISLGIIYLFAAKHLGWYVEGIQFPGHFMLRLEEKGQRVIIDPFHNGEIRQPEELRALIKMSIGEEAELLPEFFDVCTTKEILMRLLNNLKLRFIRQKKNPESIDVITIMLLFQPESARLWRQLGLLQAHTGKLKMAIKSLEKFLIFHQGDKSSDKITTRAEFEQVQEILKKLKTNKKSVIL